MRRRFIFTIWCILGFLGASFSSAYAYDSSDKIQIKGTIRVLIYDDFAAGRSKEEMRLEVFNEAEDRFESRPLSFEEMYSGDTIKFKASDFKTGDVVTVSGFEGDNGEFIVDELISKEGYREEARNNSVAEQRTAMYVIVDLNDAKVSDRYPTSTLSGVMDRVKNEIQRISFSKVDFMHDANGNGSNDLYGPIQIDASKNNCNANDYSSKALAKLRAQGVNTNLYRHHIFLLPPEISCGWLGLGHIGCGTSCNVWVKTPDNVPVIVHELGHNLGMHHAATDSNDDGVVESEYGDHSCVMGNELGNIKMLNGPHSVQKAWTDAAKTQEVTAGGTYRISPIHLPAAQAAFPQILKIKKGTQFYYLSYRQKGLADAALKPQYVTGVSIHTHAGGSAKTLHVKTLANGGSFAAGAMTVRQVAADAQSVTLTIDGGSGSGCTAAPVLSLQKGVSELAAGRSDSNLLHVVNPNGAGCAAMEFRVALATTAGLAGSMNGSAMHVGAGASADMGMSLTPRISNGKEGYTVTVQHVAGGQIVRSYVLKADAYVGQKLSYASGIAAKVYTGVWDRLPNFDTLTPVEQKVAGKIDLSVTARNEGIGLRFDGYVKIDSEGLYTFSLKSDDGSKFYVNGMELINNDGLHEAIERSGRIYLYAGYYPVRVDFFERGGGEFLTLQYEGAGLSKREVPSTALFVASASTPSRVSFTARHSGKCVSVEGANAANNVVISQSTCNGGAHQKYEMLANGDGTVRLRTFANRCVSVEGSSTADQARILQSDCVNTANQRFTMVRNTDGTYNIRTFAGRCLDVFAGSMNDQAPLIQWQCHSNNNQKFTVGQ